MNKLDQKGQISIEFVLVVGIILVLVLVFAPYIGAQSELNAVSAAARSGAMNATSEIVFLDSSAEPVRVNDIKLIGSGQNLTIQMHLSRSISGNQPETIMNGTLRSIVAQGYTRDDSGTTDTSLDDIIVTGRHNYKVTLVY